MTLLYKICPIDLWREAEAGGALLGAPADLRDGFIHFSTAGQLAETAKRHFAGQTDLVLIEVDAVSLAGGLRWEPSRGGDLFPHLYGPLPTSAARGTEVLNLDSEGSLVLPRLPLGPSSGFDPAREGWTKREETGFMDLVGPVWSKREGDERRYGFVAQARHLNRGGVVHGGMLMAFADQTLGMTSSRATAGRRQVTVQLDTHFMAAVREGEFVEARCRVVRQTRTLVFLTCTLTVGERVATTASGVWKVLGG